MPKVQRFRPVSVSSQVTQIVPYNPKRVGLLLRNYSGSEVFLSNDQVDVLNSGYPLAVGEFISFLTADGDVPELALYAVTASGTANLRVVETYGEVKS
jgi:hypothetical protein